MNSIKPDKKGFTIIELLTVMSIIIILIGVLVPALNKTRQFAKKVMQKGQFHEISKGLELFRNDHQDTYPDSDPCDILNKRYCGAMKLCEAMLGQDGMGFNPLSRFTADGTEPNGAPLYPLDLCLSIVGDFSANLRQRNRYIDPESIKSCNLEDLFGASATVTPFISTYKNAVICDVFLKTQSDCNATGGKLGMPILYYRANSSKLSHDVSNPDNPDNIYSYKDNDDLLSLNMPRDATKIHPMYSDPKMFYKETKNSRITSMSRPHNEDGYILMSAGYDNLYGTKDDVFNFTD